MANTVANVSQAKPKTTGAIYVAPSGTTGLPTSPLTALDTTVYKCLGYVSEDGVTNTNTPEASKIKAWGGDVVLVTNEGKEDTFAFTLLETKNVEALKLVYGSNNVDTTTTTDVISVKANSTAPEEFVMVIDMILKGGKAERIVIPNGTISEIGEIVYKDSEAKAFPITIDALPDATGNTHYDYIEE